MSRQDIQEIFSSLTARTVPIQNRGGSTRNPLNLRGVEIAALASNISQGAWALIRYRYVGEYIALFDLMECLADLSIDEGSRLLTLALYEALERPVCPCCSGRGELLRDARLVLCEFCRGSGGDRLSGAERARVIGISRQAWSKGWDLRYRSVSAAVCGRLAAWEEEIVARLRRELCGSEGKYHKIVGLTS